MEVMFSFLLQKIISCKGELFYSDEIKKQAAFSALQSIIKSRKTPLGSIAHVLRLYNKYNSLNAPAAVSNDASKTSSRVLGDEGWTLGESNTKEDVGFYDQKAEETDDEYMIRTCRYQTTKMNIFN
jgi:hypothetical protein